MDIHEALYTTRMMRRLRPDPIPIDVQARILDAAVRAPNGGNTQRWHFVAVDDPELIREFAQLFRRAREIEYEKFQMGTDRWSRRRRAWTQRHTPRRCNE